MQCVPCVCVHVCMFSPHAMIIYPFPNCHWNLIDVLAMMEGGAFKRWLGYKYFTVTNGLTLPSGSRIEEVWPSCLPCTCLLVVCYAIVRRPSLDLVFPTFSSEPDKHLLWVTYPGLWHFVIAATNKLRHWDSVAEETVLLPELAEITMQWTLNRCHLLPLFLAHFLNYGEHQRMSPPKHACSQVLE